jgi:hypothetical protein
MNSFFIKVTEIPGMWIQGRLCKQIGLVEQQDQVEQQPKVK